MTKTSARLISFMAWLGLWLVFPNSGNSAQAGEFKSTLGLTTFYDAPSVKAEKVFIANEGYPLEIIVTLSNMYKVRDSSGQLAWVEQKALGDRRTLLVQVAIADIRTKPDEMAPVAFQAEQNVVLELVSPPESGWVKVKHQDGQTGYTHISQLWGL